MGLFRGNTPAFSFGVAAWLLGCQPAVEDPIRAASRFVASLMVEAVSVPKTMDTRLKK